jgi:excisionase family DNA binding protein
MFLVWDFSMFAPCLPSTVGGNDSPSRSSFESLLTKSETARILDASVRSIEGWIAHGLLKVTRPGAGRLVRIDPADLRDFIDRAKAQPSSLEGVHE